MANKEIIHPAPNLSMMDTHESPEDVVLPPVLKRQPGRPRKNIRREPGEAPSGSGAARRSLTVRCDNCKEFRHNRMTCQRAPVATKKRSAKRGIGAGTTAGTSIPGPSESSSSGPTPQSQVSSVGTVSKAKDKGKRKAVSKNVTKTGTNKSKLRRVAKNLFDGGSQVSTQGAAATTEPDQANEVTTEPSQANQNAQRTIVEIDDNPWIHLSKSEYAAF